MVNSAISTMLLFAQEAGPKVPEPTRTIVLMALLGIVLLGLLLIAFAMLGASWVRKQGYRRRSVVPTDIFLHHDQEPESLLTGSKFGFNAAETSLDDTVSGDDTLSGDDTVVT
jgi:hypothetical protein